MQTKLILIIVGLELFILCKSQEKELDGDQDAAVSIDGDYVLGGLFPVHERGQLESTCGPINAERGIQRLEAMLFAIDRINSENNFFKPALTLGVKIFDTCSRDTYARDQAVKFIPDITTENDEKLVLQGEIEEEKIIGVIGGAYSSVSIMVANLLRLFKLPQISYASTSAELSDKTRYDFFARTVPPDTLQARAMADIVLAFNWSYVSTVASEGGYGEAGIEIFENEVKSKKVCIALSIVIPSGADSKTFDGVIAQLRGKPEARAVALFLRGDDAVSILAAAKRARVKEGDFVWIASDGWGAQSAVVKNHEAEAEGALTIVLHNIPIKEFDQYFLNLRPENNQRNPWFTEYWEYKFNCLLPNCTGSAGSPSSTCDGTEKPSDLNYVQNNKVSFVIDAVYSMAYAIQKIQKDLCFENNENVCSDPPDISGSDLYSTLLSLSFTNIAGSTVEFDLKGDGKGKYDIMNFQKSNGEYIYRKVGGWDEQLDLNVSKVMFGQTLLSHLDPVGIPYSRCSEPCKPGEIKKTVNDPCCWICTKCLSNQYVKDEFICEDCPDGSWPKLDFSGCNKLTLESVRMNEPASVLSLFIASLGILFTLITVAVFLKYKETPIVKASAREMNYILLLGVFMLYLMTFILLAPPTTFICGLQRIGLGLSFSICYSSILTKINLIYRIFHTLPKDCCGAKFISPRSQCIICFCIFCVQLVVETSWLVIRPPKIAEVIPDKYQPVVILKCLTGEREIVVMLSYNLLLVLLCTIYAFKIRKIPGNFNESKFIAFMMYSTCVIWLGLVPVYFGIADKYKLQITTMCIAVSMNAYVTLGCLFLPKIYIILFQPDKNVATKIKGSSKPTRRTSQSFASMDFDTK